MYVNMLDSLAKNDNITRYELGDAERFCIALLNVGDNYKKARDLSESPPKNAWLFYRRLRKYQYFKEGKVALDESIMENDIPIYIMILVAKGQVERVKEVS
jgi:hypothetical protein